MSNAPYIDSVKARIEPLRNEIINHKVYSVIKSIDDLNVFMQYHVYAVWDFVSLLKTLQNNLTCTTIPWFPKGDAETRHLINEIVVGEESDVDQDGIRKSHFELYLDAMKQSGANTGHILNFISELKSGKDLKTAFNAAGTPEEAQMFVNFTFDVINSGKEHLQSAIFTFGREDLIPGMFMSLINDLDKNSPGNISVFKYYLERHIEVDGDHHSHLALQMTANLCRNDARLWKEAEEVTVQSLQQRIGLWNGVYNELSRKSILV